MLDDYLKNLKFLRKSNRYLSKRSNQTDPKKYCVVKSAQFNILKKTVGTYHPFTLAKTNSYKDCQKTMKFYKNHHHNQDIINHVDAKHVKAINNIAVNKYNYATDRQKIDQAEADDSKISKTGKKFGKALMKIQTKQNGVKLNPRKKTDMDRPINVKEGKTDIKRPEKNSDCFIVDTENPLGGLANVNCSLDIQKFRYEDEKQRREKRPFDRSKRRQAVTKSTKRKSPLAEFSFDMQESIKLPEDKVPRICDGKNIKTTRTTGFKIGS